ncbi:MAG: CPBP family intramembrane metalloprotease [Bacteroidaceae bacterium]|nr:CPBP family intramembrane metalloprotease [Bacteroidaceae bacterium]
MKRILLFSILACGLVCIAAGVFYVMNYSYESHAAMLLASLCMLVPAAVTIFMQAVIEKERPSHRIGLRFRPNWWWLACWLLPAMLSIATMGVSCLYPHTDFSFHTDHFTTAIDKINSAAQGKLTITPQLFLVTNFINGLIAGATINALLALGEEVGWRGYLLRLFSGKPFVLSAIVIGFIWGIWHLPLILLGHNYPHHPIMGSALMLVFCITLSPIMQYLRLKSGSLIAVAIFHGTFNAFGGLGLLCLNNFDELLDGSAGLAGILVLLAADVLLYCHDSRFSKSSIFKSGIPLPQ